MAFFSALGVGGLSSLGLLDRTEEAGTSMLQVEFIQKKFLERVCRVQQQTQRTLYNALEKQVKIWSRKVGNIFL